jgi:hypothetical protein
MFVFWYHSPNFLDTPLNYVTGKWSATDIRLLPELMQNLDVQKLIKDDSAG